MKAPKNVYVVLDRRGEPDSFWTSKREAEREARWFDRNHPGCGPHAVETYQLKRARRGRQ
jgi:hypothetical protein